MRRSTAGDSPSTCGASRGWPRSIASVYWVRSFVPIEKKSTSVANWSASSAADGTSTMMPASMRGASSRCRSSSRMARAARHSSSVAIIGNMTATLPSPAAREDRPQLRAQQLGTVQQHADAALAEKRIVLARQRQVRQRLVAADVERPDDQPPPAPERARHVAVDGQLLLLGRRGRPLQEQKLRSQQADRLRTERDALLGVGQPADVRRHLHAVAVERRRRLVGLLLMRPGAGATAPPGAGGCGRCRRSTGSGAACLWSRRG